MSSPEGAEVRLAGEWGQQLGGGVGGSPELNPYELGLSDRELGGTSDESSPGEEAHENGQRLAQEQNRLKRVT